MNKHTRYGLFLEADDDAASGGSAAAGFLGAPAIEKQGGDAPEDDGLGDLPPEGDEPPATPPAAPALTAEALAAAFKAAGIGAPAAPATPRGPTTPEELADLKKRLNYWEPDDTFFTKLNNMETQKEAFLAMRDALTQQMASIMQAYVTEQQGGLSQQFAPALQYIAQQEETARMSRFDKSYSQLADPSLRPLLSAVADGLRKTGKTYSDETALFKDVAAGMAAILKQTNPNFKLSPGSSPGKQTTGITPAPRRGGGGAGGSSSASQTAGVPLAVSLLPKVR